MRFRRSDASELGIVKSPLNGGIYTDVKDGLAVTGNAGSSKVGTAQAMGILGLKPYGDASSPGCQDAGITRIHHDYDEVLSVGSS